MFVTIILAALAIFLTLVGMYCHWLYMLTKQKASLLESARDYFSPQDENTLSQFAQLTDVLGKQLAGNVTQSLKSSFMGMQSVDSKNLARLEQDVAQDELTAVNPLLSAILSQYPSVARRLAKNPHLIGLFANMLRTKGAQDVGKGNGSTQGSFELKV